MMRDEYQPPAVDFDVIRQQSALAAPFKAPRPIRSFQEIAGVYSFTLLPPGVSFTLNHLRRERHELIGELSVGCDIPGSRTTPTGTLFTADFNLSSARARTERANILKDRSRSSEVDWLGYLEEFCEEVYGAIRAGDPLAYIDTAPLPAPNAVLECAGIPLLRQHPMILFGDGGTGKSYLALYWAGLLTQAGERVLYLDWELDISDHRARLDSLFGLGGPHIGYLHCVGTLVEEVPRIQRAMREQGTTYAIFDSIGFACPQPEASDAALAYLRATRALGKGSLHLAHINKSEEGDQKPFGSNFWHNGARATWNVKADTDRQPGEALKLGLYHRKHNLSEKLAPRAFEVGIGATHTTVRRIEMGTVRTLAAKLALQDQIALALKGEPKSTADLADELEGTKESIERKVRAYKERFTRVPGTDGSSRIALVSRQRA